jgi:nitrite reductase/ring-hydroxylating ferredoxin subunit
MPDVIIERKLCNSDDFPNDTMKEIEIKIDDEEENNESKTVKVLLIKQHNKFFCLATKCSHYSVPLVNGVVYKNRLRCFAHGACFDIRTGDIEDYPGVDCLPKYEVYIDRDRDVYLRANRAELLTSKRVKGETGCKSRPSSAAVEHRPCSANIRGRRFFMNLQNS